MTNPSTPGEWQEAVDAAHGALCLDAARLYGLVRGGPEVNVPRCEEILENGRMIGFRPNEDAVERFLRGGV
jgi:hypothetical protein